ncbi:MAG: DUF4139 domain-containing protein [Pirellulaceae bacterium]|nr:hypothetical protein [Thermoguttaceae bacterium]MDI9446593.1 hypothetical protein [Planctomycetota bacterium]NLY99643.1 DUF4139 domain-containing protein [Pirellulaceae bacterium]
MTKVSCSALSVLMVVLAAAAAADVDLVTIPRREGTQLTIYNSDDITMVREHRLLTVKQGINRIQFTWAETLIDPTSIDFRILDHEDQVDLIDTTYPPGRNDALQWNIHSQFAGKIAVEIRYFTSGITWAASYVGLANADETKLDLTGYVHVENRSGELYDNAQIRLVVGTINLVEKIADLAQRPAPGTTYGQASPAAKPEMRRQLAEKSDEYLFRARGGKLDRGMAVDKAKDVKKQGLSEYFLFTIEGRETIEDGQPMRLVSMKVGDVPLECLYKLSDRDGGTAFAKYYRFKNLKLIGRDGKENPLADMENLGVSPLPNGSVRLFSEYPNKDLAYVGGTEIKHVPIGDRVEVNVGPDTEITITRRLKDQKITDTIARQYERRLDDEFIRHYDLIDYDETFFYEEEIVSGKAAPVKVEIERAFDAGVVLWSGENPPADWNASRPGAYVDLHTVPGRVERVDETHLKYFLDLEPGKKTFVTYSVTYKRRKVGPELNTEKIRRPL